ncbi:methylated-DNA--[protein]-cysteine S-methyltransferase [Emticicia fluvialis]|uniref:methylated-DNA--[protein]-cysteine S-methyltransferase n=1 Tax=Emticicia fluvialis TaxID=2974474 RepID=UPI002165247C|nr:methylated-DNA--[protein]-cysteine S-methyltransferase [Emticicia fluvialis]
MIYVRHYQSPLGALELIATHTHLTHVLFREAQKKPSRQLKETLENSPIIDECIRQFDAYFSGQLTEFDLPLLPAGTDFQKLVWETLKSIPYGKTISYLELSRRLGNEKAIRAVGVANGNNPLTIILPCHRVIGSDKTLVGYGGDLWRKEWLLRHEGSLPKQEQLNLF